MNFTPEKIRCSNYQRPHVILVVIFHVLLLESAMFDTGIHMIYTYPICMSMSVGDMKGKNIYSEETLGTIFNGLV